MHASRAFERMIQCVMTALDRNPLDFAACLPHFLKLYCETALVSMDAATVHSIRAKRRVLLTRFLARALLSPFYRHEWLHSPVPGMSLMSEVHLKRFPGHCCSLSGLHVQTPSNAIHHLACRLANPLASAGLSF